LVLEDLGASLLHIYTYGKLVQEDPGEGAKMVL